MAEPLDDIDRIEPLVRSHLRWFRILGPLVPWVCRLIGHRWGVAMEGDDWQQLYCARCAAIEYRGEITGFYPPDDS